MNLFRSSDEPFTAAEMEIAQPMAEMAAIGLIQERALRERNLLIAGVVQWFAIYIMPLLAGSGDNVLIVAVIGSCQPGAGRTGASRNAAGPGLWRDVVWGCLLGAALGHRGALRVK